MREFLHLTTIQKTKEIASASIKQIASDHFEIFLKMKQKTTTGKRKQKTLHVKHLVVDLELKEIAERHYAFNEKNFNLNLYTLTKI